MNNAQLFLAIGIPSLLVILNMFQSNRISDKIDRLAADNHRDHLMLMRDQVALNERVAKVETRLDGK